VRIIRHDERRGAKQRRKGVEKEWMMKEEEDTVEVVSVTSVLFSELYHPFLNYIVDRN